MRKSAIRKSAVRKSAIVAVAVAAALGGTSAGAATMPVYLDSVRNDSGTRFAFADVAGSTATWVYDSATGVVAGSGLLSAGYSVGITPLFTDSVIDLQIGNGSPFASASAYSCIEGAFGGLIGASICGVYNFGANFINESMVSYGPGTAYSRTIAGDDVSVGFDARNLSTFNGMTVRSFDGVTLTLSNVFSFPDGRTFGETMTFTTVPIPAAAWLFGSALGLLSWARRKPD